MESLVDSQIEECNVKIGIVFNGQMFCHIQNSYHRSNWSGTRNISNILLIIIIISLFFFLSSPLYKRYSNFIIKTCKLKNKTMRFIELFGYIFYFYLSTTLFALSIYSMVIKNLSGLGVTVSKKMNNCEMILYIDEHVCFDKLCL